MKRQSTKLEKIFANFVTDRGLISRFHKELKKVNYKKKNPVKKYVKDMNRQFLKDETMINN